MDRGGGQSEQERNLYAAAASASAAGWLAMADKGKAAARGDSVLRCASTTVAHRSVNVEVFTWCCATAAKQSIYRLSEKKGKGVEGACR
jgi:hypothetical protein